MNFFEFCQILEAKLHPKQVSQLGDFEKFNIQGWQIFIVDKLDGLQKDANVYYKTLGDEDFYQEIKDYLTAFYNKDESIHEFDLDIIENAWKHNVKLRDLSNDGYGDDLAEDISKLDENLLSQIISTPIQVDKNIFNKVSNINYDDFNNMSPQVYSDRDLADVKSDIFKSIFYNIDASDFFNILKKHFDYQFSNHKYSESLKHNIQDMISMIKKSLEVYNSWNYINIKKLTISYHVRSLFYLCFYHIMNKIALKNGIKPNDKFIQSLLDGNMIKIPNSLEMQRYDDDNLIDKLTDMFVRSTSDILYSIQGMDKDEYKNDIINATTKVLSTLTSMNLRRFHRVPIIFNFQKEKQPIQGTNAFASGLAYKDKVVIYGQQNEQDLISILAHEIAHIVYDRLPYDDQMKIKEMATNLNIYSSEYGKTNYVFQGATEPSIHHQSGNEWFATMIEYMVYHQNVKSRVLDSDYIHPTPDNKKQYKSTLTNVKKILGGAQNYGIGYKKPPTI